MGDDGEAVPHVVPERYYEFAAPLGDCIVAGAVARPIRLMLEFAECLAGPFAVLYVLLDPRGERPPARYQSPFPLGRKEMTAFFERFEEFLETDGRHAVWIMTDGCEERIIYDRHEAIFCYGPLKSFERVLVRHGYAPGRFTMPLIHRHDHRPELDPEEDRLMEWFAWIPTPLLAGDEV